MDKIDLKSEVKMKEENFNYEDFKDVMLQPLEDPLETNCDLKSDVLHEGEIVGENQIKLENVLMKVEASSVKVEQEVDNHNSGYHLLHEGSNFIDDKQQSTNPIPPQGRRKSLSEYGCFICKICHVGLNTYEAFQNHLSTVHPDRFKYSCRHCSKKFQQDHDRLKHETIHDINRFEGEATFPCKYPDCSKKYHLKDSLLSHVRKVHKGWRSSKRPSKFPIRQHHSVGVRASGRAYPCPSCDLKFPFRYQMEDHVITHGEYRPFACEKCDAKFRSLSSFTKHVKSEHSGAPPRPKLKAPKLNGPTPSDSSSCICETCGKKFPKPSVLKRHMNTHTGDKPYECSFKCGFRCGRPEGIVRHEHRHRMNPMLSRKCRVCGREFVAFNDLHLHRKTFHWDVPYESEKEKAFGCYICGKPYFTKGEAAVCTVFSHDPSTLLKDMFKFKCHRCPGSFGYHNFSALLKHWEGAHPGFPPPNKWHKSYGENGVKGAKDFLPSVRVPLKEAKKLKETGIPPEPIKHPLWVELPLLEASPEPSVSNSKERRKPERPVSCDICKRTIYKRSSLKKHLRLIHGFSEDEISHKIKGHSISIDGRNSKKLREITKKNLFCKQIPSKTIDSSLSQLSPCQVEPTIKLSSEKLEEIKCGAPGDTATSRKKTENQSYLTVNVKDNEMIRRLLGGKELKVEVFRF